MLLRPRLAERREILESMKRTYSLPTVTRSVCAMRAQRFANSLLCMDESDSEPMVLDRATTASHAIASHIAVVFGEALRISRGGYRFSPREEVSLHHMLVFLRRGDFDLASLGDLPASIETLIPSSPFRENYSIKCPYCKDDVTVGSARCTRGHVLEYCCLTQLLIELPSHRHCTTCGAVALPASEINRNDNIQFRWLVYGSREETGNSAEALQPKPECVVCGHELTIMDILTRGKPS